MFTNIIDLLRCRVTRMIPVFFVLVLSFVLTSHVSESFVRGPSTLVGNPSWQTSRSWAPIRMAANDYGSFNRRATDVVVDAPSWNSRRITASIVVNSPVDDVWSILTDYNRLAERVPNLIQSYVVADGKSTGNGKTRIFQEGAQKIIGFDFRASLMMDMTIQEGLATAGGEAERRLFFTLAESRMFTTFDGSWQVRPQESGRSNNGGSQGEKTVLTYTVLVRPKGPVPVVALEWRIKEDVPVNLLAVQAAAEQLSVTRVASTARVGRPTASRMTAGTAARSASGVVGAGAVGRDIPILTSQPRSIPAPVSAIAGATPAPIPVIGSADTNPTTSTRHTIRSAALITVALAVGGAACASSLSVSTGRK